MSDIREITPDEMNKYIVRFGEQMSVRDRVTKVLKVPVPDWLFGRLFARDLYNFVGKTTNPANQFATEGPADTSMFVARMPPKFGPTYLHSHKNTWEIFFVITGKWRVTYGKNGEHTAELNRYDCIAIPPKVVRNFENIADEEADMLVVIAGAEDATELEYTEAVTAEVEQKAGVQTRTMLESFGLRFMG